VMRRMCNELTDSPVTAYNSYTRTFRTQDIWFSIGIFRTRTKGSYREHSFPGLLVSGNIRSPDVSFPGIIIGAVNGYWRTRGLDNSRMLPVVVLVVLVT